MAFSTTVDFNASPEQVFPWLVDPEKSKQWLPGVESTVFEGDPTRVGTKFVQRTRRGNQVSEYPGEVTAYEKDRRYAVALNQTSVTIAVEYLLDWKAEGGTKLTFTCDFLNGGKYMKALGVLLGWLARPMLRQLFAKLKVLVDGEAGGSNQTWGPGPGIQR